jgi:hypothetical protein
LRVKNTGLLVFPYKKHVKNSGEYRKVTVGGDEESIVDPEESHVF